MAVSPGTRLGPFEVSAKIGEGGMGEVYRARDTTLDRDVAIKVLPGLFADDAERMARFEREAKVLASLNHPNIATIYGFEQSGDTRALVLELVEGPTLADRIARGPIPLDEALPIARQIADALEGAHDAGVIHRDLKPANIKVTDDGTVKVLDFGLAKALESSGASARADLTRSASPTISLTAMATQAGRILGTAAYMSPEQARGKTVDRRTDIWAFGAVLYEMLTGRRAFEGEDVSMTLAEVMKSEPDLDRLPAGSPLAIRRLLSRCFAKDRTQRLRDAGDAALELADSAEPDEPVPAGPIGDRHWKVAALALGFVVVATAGVAMWQAASRDDVQPRVTTQFAVPVTSLAQDLQGGTISLSPDGRTLAYAASVIHLRPLAGTATTVVPNTDGATTHVFSPDGQSIAFVTGGTTIRKVPVEDGPVVTLADATAASRVRGLAWTGDGRIIFGSLNGPLYQVSEDSGQPEPLTEPVPGAIHAWPSIDPDTNILLYRVVHADPEVDGLYVQSLATGQGHRLLAGEVGALVTHEELIFIRDGSLWVGFFDPDTYLLRGAPIPLRGDIGQTPVGLAHLAASRDGSVAYASYGGTARALGWVDRTGSMQPIADEEGLGYPRLSPDGTQIAFTLLDGVFTFDLVRGATSLLASRGFYPVWTPDGDALLFSGVGAASLYRKAVGSLTEAELLHDAEHPMAVGGLVGTTIVAHEQDLATMRRDIVILDLAEPGRVTDWVATAANETAPVLSPDGNWIAYSSDESGQFEVHLRSMDDRDVGQIVSSGGGSEPVWSRDGSELFFRSDENLMVVSVLTQPTLVVGQQRILFADPYVRAGPNGVRQYDVSDDGRFLMLAEDDAVSDIVVTRHWMDELRRLHAPE